MKRTRVFVRLMLKGRQKENWRLRLRSTGSSRAESTKMGHWGFSSRA